MITYTTREAAERAGANYRRVDYWVRNGYAPCAGQANGSGSRRAFTDRDVFVLRALTVVSDAIPSGGSNSTDSLLADVANHARATASALPEVVVNETHSLRVRLSDLATLTLEVPMAREAVSA